jgi:ActR/RegA family two-component response regulator
MARRPADGHEEQIKSGWGEVVKLIPQILWFSFAVVAFIVLFPTLKSLIQTGSITKVAIVGVEINLARVPVERGPDPIATAKQPLIPPAEAKALTDRFHRMKEKTEGATVLWVDDKHPYQNVRERRVLTAAGMYVDIASSTEEGLRWLDASKYDIVITNLRRNNEINTLACTPGSEVITAGCYFIAEINSRFYDRQRLAIIAYVGVLDERFGIPAHASGITNRPSELFYLILNALVKREVKESSP